MIETMSTQYFSSMFVSKHLKELLTSLKKNGSNFEANETIVFQLPFFRKGLFIKDVRT